MPPAAPRPRRSLPAGAGCVGAGLVTAGALPPWGLWPVAFVGIALLDRLIADRSRRSRFARGALFSIGWLGPGMAWMWFLTIPGYLAAVGVFSLYHGTACAVIPAGRWRRLALPAALVIAEAIRFSFPFGGVPLASLAIGQAAGPLALTARLGGAIALSWLTLVGGMAASAATQRQWRPAVAALAVVLVVAVLGALSPYGHDIGTVRVALVQGGGPQGTHAVNTDPELVLKRHLAESGAVQPPVDVVVWPENVIDVADFSASNAREQVAAEAARLGAPFVVGVTEEAGNDQFINAQIVVMPDGTQAGRYDKVRRVPFGEYMPMRGFLHALGAPTNLVPRNAVAGTGPAYVDVPGVGRIAVVISWEVFFGGRAHDGVSHGAELIINPTNGSSYTWTILQTQQIASSRLRAIEEGRWVAQVAPTGFTAFVNPSGVVHDRTEVSEAAVRERTITRRQGRTLYAVIGDKTVVVLAAAVLGLALWLAARSQALADAPGASGVDLEEDGDGTVVDELDGHLGAEPAGGDGGASAT